RAPPPDTALAKAQAVPGNEEAPQSAQRPRREGLFWHRLSILSRRRRTPRKTGHDNLSRQRTNPEIGTGIEPRARAKGNAGPRSRSCDHPTARERRPHEETAVDRDCLRGPQPERCERPVPLEIIRRQAGEGPITTCASAAASNAGCETIGPLPPRGKRAGDEPASKRNPTSMRPAASAC